MAFPAIPFLSCRSVRTLPSSPWLSLQFLSCPVVPRAIHLTFRFFYLFPILPSSHHTIRIRKFPTFLSFYLPSFTFVPTFLFCLLSVFASIRQAHSSPLTSFCCFHYFPFPPLICPSIVTYLLHLFILCSPMYQLPFVLPDHFSFCPAIYLPYLPCYPYLLSRVCTSFVPSLVPSDRYIFYFRWCV